MPTYPNTELRGIENGEIHDLIRRLEYATNHLKLNEWVQAYVDLDYTLEKLRDLKHRSPVVVMKRELV
jgi:hypothetical protein